MIKSSLKSILFIALYLSLINCSGGSSEIVLHTQEGIDNLNKLLKSEFDLEKEITSLSISNLNSNSPKVDQITIFFVENNMMDMWFYSITTSKLHKPDPKEKSDFQPRSQKIKDLNTAKILTNYKEAVAMITNTTDEFANFYIYGYEIQVNKDSDTTEHSFDVYAEKTSKGVSYYGKRLVENKFKFSFDTDKSGQLICTDGLDVF
ncbi:hypothetical protein [Sediminicola luteus]|uniref:Uncharacterized protein n=1 Tax=Sediminicola luteus TaxID=319238 RepID=A0A2A4GCS5_9FLAO|nr:hypothetical protein [Sediminicola luteus]PCE65774.1 hypothetical protein B7P33_00260 [Sediminicola luteus]